MDIYDLCAELYTDGRTMAEVANDDPDAKLCIKQMLADDKFTGRAFNIYTPNTKNPLIIQWAKYIDTSTIMVTFYDKSIYEFAA